jgi:hypothetical protein
MSKIDAERARLLIDAHLANIRFDRITDYVRRGRRFASNKWYTLKFEWRDLHASFDGVLGSEEEWVRLHDLEAELALRDETVPPPRKAYGVHGRWREDHAKRLRGEPGEWGEVERCLYDAALLFEESCRRVVRH